MPDSDEFLSDTDLVRVERLLDALDKSSVDYMKVQVGELSITLGKGDARGLAGETAPAAAAKPAPAPPAKAEPAAPATPAPAAPAPAMPAPTEGTIIAAPMMGRFYAKPEPEADPFVTVGADVAAETTVCLIEVMKTFTSVPAGVSGRIVEILVEDEAIVEYGQPLFRVSES